MKTFIFVGAALMAATAALGQENNPGMAPQFLPLQDSTVLDTGQEVYTYWCAACHMMGKPGSVALMTLREEQMPTDLADNDYLDAEYVRYLVRNGQSAMPHFRQTQISDAQLDLLADYLSASSE